MKFQDIATFSGNILTFLGLPALIFFNFSSFLFFLNEWKIPFICGSVVILITTLIYHRKKRRYPNKSSCFSLLVLFFAMGCAIFYQPYPEFAQISISGFYNEKDGGWNSSNTDENAYDITHQMEETWKRATSKENPSFQLVPPFAVENWQFPTLFLTHRSKQQIINLAEANSRSVVTLVGFTRDNKIEKIHYSLNGKLLSPNAHSINLESRWFNQIFDKIISQSQLTDAQKREIIAKILFIDINARTLSARKDEMDAIGMANLVVKIRSEVIDLKGRYPFIDDELNFLMAGLTASFVDVYSAELSDDVAAGFLVQALSFHPYYPYPDKESFQRAYVKNSYDKWKLTNDAENDVTLLSHLAQLTYFIEDTKEKEKIIDEFKNQVFLQNQSPTIFYSMLEMIKTSNSLLDIPVKQIHEIKEIEDYTDNFLYQHPGMDDEFIELKSALLYGVCHTWYVNHNRKKDASRLLRKFTNIVDNNPNVLHFLIKMKQEDSE